MELGFLVVLIMGVKDGIPLWVYLCPPCINQDPWGTSKDRDLLRLLQGRRSDKIPDNLGVLLEPPS